MRQPGAMERSISTVARRMAVSPMLWLHECVIRKEGLVM
jgi:hypothetical protein